VCLFRSSWFLLPEGSKISEAFPVERGLENLLTQRYQETLPWIERKADETDDGTAQKANCDEIIVEKIVSLVPEEMNFSTTEASDQIPAIQLHDPQSPDISRYFLVFRQGSTDYSRLCVEKKIKGNGVGGTNPLPPPSHSRSSDSKTSPPLLESSTSTTTTTPTLNSHFPDSPAVLPLESLNPLPSRSVLSASASSTDLSAGSRNNSRSNSGSIRDGATSPLSASNHSPAAGNGYHSFRLYRTYASFYHALANGTSSGRVKTQRQTSSTIDGSGGESLKDPISYNNNNNNSSKGSSSHQKSSSTSSPNMAPCPTPTPTNNPALDAAIQWKSIRAQSHSFKGHPLPSPEIPCDLGPAATVKYAIFVVHGVGQRAFRKMGFHFNKDCDEMRNVLLDAAQLRGLPPGSTTVLPVSWRAELNLAGNFTFGDESDDDEEGECQFEEQFNVKPNSNNSNNNGNNGNSNNNNNSNNSNNSKIDQDLKDLTKSFNSNLDESSRTFQRAVSVFEGQFTEILERLALESIPAVRSVLSDATMDILLYVSQKHFNKILGAVISEVLRLHRLFSHWNPQFSGEFSFVAHSLGSALVADLLSFTISPDSLIGQLSDDNKSKQCMSREFMKIADGHVFPFKIDKFFAMGSPLGVFHLLKHTKPIGCIHSQHIETALENRTRKWRSARSRPGGRQVADVPAWSVYNCKQFYNLFHPHDPVAHRFESLALAHQQSRNNVNPPQGPTLLPPPLKIPYHKSGLTRFKMDLEAKIARAKDDWSKLSFRLPTWLGGQKVQEEPSEEAEINLDESKASTNTLTTSNTSTTSNKSNTSNTPTTPNTSTSSIEIRNDSPLAAFNQNFCRVDFSLQDSVMENPYISALGAHFVYWSDLDIAAFIVSELIKN
jgi:hypothetical protein